MEISMGLPSHITSLIAPHPVLRAWGQKLAERRGFRPDVYSDHMMRSNYISSNVTVFLKYMNTDSISLTVNKLLDDFDHALTKEPVCVSCKLSELIGSRTPLLHLQPELYKGTKRRENFCDVPDYQIQIRTCTCVKFEPVTKDDIFGSSMIVSPPFNLDEKSSLLAMAIALAKSIAMNSDIVWRHRRTAVVRCAMDF